MNRQCVECWQWQPNHKPGCSRGAKVHAQERRRLRGAVERYPKGDVVPPGADDAAPSKPPPSGEE